MCYRLGEETKLGNTSNAAVRRNHEPNGHVLCYRLSEESKLGNTSNAAVRRNHIPKGRSYDLLLYCLHRFTKRKHLWRFCDVYSFRPSLLMSRGSVKQTKSVRVQSANPYCGLRGNVFQANIQLHRQLHRPFGMNLKAMRR
jgi:hypothetical protein